MLSALDKAIIRIIQEELPLVPQPYKLIADELGISEEELLNRVQQLHNEGILRRFGAILHHRKAGFKANAMVVWAVAEDKIEEAGKAIADFNEVSHCYQRMTAEGWPYNLFSMVHGQTPEECEDTVRRISNAINIDSYEVLYSTEEIKKSSMKYFLKED